MRLERIPAGRTSENDLAAPNLDHIAADEDRAGRVHAQGQSAAPTREFSLVDGNAQGELVLRGEEPAAEVRAG